MQGKRSTWTPTEYFCWGRSEPCWRQNWKPLCTCGWQWPWTAAPRKTAFPWDQGRAPQIWNEWREPLPAWCTSSESGLPGRSAPLSSLSPPRKDPLQCFGPLLFPVPSCCRTPRKTGLGWPRLLWHRRPHGCENQWDPYFLLPHWA